TYVTATGKEYEYDGDLPVTVDNVSGASFAFRELYFDPSQAETGTWRGTATLVAVPKAGFGDDVGETEALAVESNPIETALRVGPSLVLDKLQSVDGKGCADVTRSTNAGHELALGFRAIGLGQASEANPWTFRIQYASP